MPFATLFYHALQRAELCSWSRISGKNGEVLAQPRWQGRLTLRDYAALTPRMWEHVNLYGRFDLDVNARLTLCDRNGG